MKIENINENEFSYNRGTEEEELESTRSAKGTKGAEVGWETEEGTGRGVRGTEVEERKDRRGGQGRGTETDVRDRRKRH